MNIIEIIEIGLNYKGFDGLYDDGICGCEIGELSPGRCLSERCEAGYKHTHSQYKDRWVISDSKNHKTDEEIDEIIGDF